jgi:hypothetical protein
VSVSWDYDIDDVARKMKVLFGSSPPLPSDEELRQSMEELWALRIAVEAEERAAAAIESDSQSAPPAPSSRSNVRLLYPDGPLRLPRRI